MGVQIPPCEGTILIGEGHCKIYELSEVSYTKTAEPFEMRFVTWTGLCQGTVLDGDAEFAGVENVGVDLSAPDYGAGKCGSGNIRKNNVWKVTLQYACNKPNVVRSTVPMSKY